MKRWKTRDQKGWGLFDLVFWVVILTALAWGIKQYILHPEALNPRPVTHSPLEDSK
jgi:hypothetical protein